MENNASISKTEIPIEPCCEKQKFKMGFLTMWAFMPKVTLFINVLILAGLFILGWMIDPEITRILWLSITGLLLVVVLPLLIYMGKRISQCNDTCISENNIKL